MKKTTLKTIAIALVMTLMLAMTACGGNKDAALEKYFQTDEMQEMVQEAKDSVEGSGMSIEILAEGNTLIYEYTFEEDSFDDSMLDAVKEQLVSGLESTASTFEGIASDLVCSIFALCKSFTVIEITDNNRAVLNLELIV